MLYSFNTTLLEMEQKLRDAARVGDINTLYALIRDDPNLLKKIDEIPFFDTPLHIAASVGQTHFAIEVMRLQPSFGRKLNPDGFSPMHLALQNYTLQSQAILADKLADTVRRLVKFDSELIRVQGKEGITPLHYIAQTEKVLNWKDENGNTVLHIAASTNQEQVVKLLVKEGLQKNAKNSMGFTALDVALQSETPVDKSIIDILRHAKVVSYSSLQNLASRADFLSSKERFYEKVMRVFLMGRRELSIDMRNLVLVVAVLVATATYQAALSPPGGVRQASDNNETEDIAGNTVH
ncbi:hypothetical protein F0562_007916 [Nyssa sinensis]|uniref:PGG domain-containing protein n=1 Tax=Nyssa sinensis TaxID=561372 RepID=A0A5J5A705_9ASTE|nr:hypothetical protein F0562_007916 [Nyssa sinensis]